MSQETDVSIVRAIERLEDKFSQKIDNLEQKLGQKLEQELGKVNARIDNLEQKFEQKLEQELGKVNVKINNLEQKLEQGLEKISDNLDKNSAEIVDVKIAVAKVDASLSEWRPSIQKIPDLAEKIGESKNWLSVVIIAITAIVT